MNSNPKYRLTRKHTGWLLSALNIGLLSVVIVSVPFVGVGNVWEKVVPWVAVPAAFTFPSSIQTSIGRYIWMGLATLVTSLPEGGAFNAWNALGIAAMIATGLVTLPLSYYVGIRIFDSTQKYGAKCVIGIYLAISVLAYLLVNAGTSLVDKWKLSIVGGAIECIRYTCPNDWIYRM